MDDSTKTTKKPTKVLLVHAHSNGCDIGDMRQTLQNISDSLKVHVTWFQDEDQQKNGIHPGKGTNSSPEKGL